MLIDRATTLNRFLELARVWESRGMNAMEVLDEFLAFYRDVRVKGADLDRDDDTLRFEWGYDFKASRYVSFVRHVCTAGSDEEAEPDEPDALFVVDFYFDPAAGEKADDELFVKRPTRAEAALRELKGSLFVAGLLATRPIRMVCATRDWRHPLVEPGEYRRRREEARKFPETPGGTSWLEPWEKAVGWSGDSLVAIARQDLGVDHVLHDVGVLPIGRRIDNDDVLFATTDPAKPFVLVHLTLAIQPETNPAHAEVFTGWQDWVDRSMIPDHVRYCGKYLFTVKIAPFPIANRGLVVESNRSSIEWLSSMRIGSSLMLLRNGMPPLATNVKGTETLNHANPEHPLCILLDGNLDRADVPIGTEVWLVDAEDRP